MQGGRTSTCGVPERAGAMPDCAETRAGSRRKGEREKQRKRVRGSERKRGGRKRGEGIEKLDEAETKISRRNKSGGGEDWKARERETEVPGEGVAPARICRARSARARRAPKL
eukprot:6209635-Pleurochrysis_carterae.AAC.3